MNILIYFPYNQRTVEQQSVMEMLANKGYSVFLLTLSPENYLHNYVRKLGVKAYASPVKETSGIKNILKNARYLVGFCKQHKIDVIIAHQQVAALPLIFAKPFIKSKSFYLRHNTDEDYKQFPKKAFIMNKFINLCIPAIIAPSDAVYKFMTEKEGLSSKKIKRINYGYNFAQYEKADDKTIKEIQEKYKCRFLILSIARLVPAKRHTIMFQAVKSLLQKGLDIKMICLGDGFLKQGLQEWINMNELNNNIFLLGIQPNIFDYLSAAQVLLHLSESEASNSVVKEAGLVKKTVIVCNNVGDFGDYIISGQNGFLVNKENPLEETIHTLENCYNDSTVLDRTGNNLQQAIVKGFDINNVSSLYDSLLNNPNS